MQFAATSTLEAIPGSAWFGPVPSLRDCRRALEQFDSALTDIELRSALRERLEQRSGAECHEFLIAARSFCEAVNPLQRYQLLCNIVHRFVRPGAERSVPLSQACRADFLAEWKTWDGRGRIPARVNIQAIEDATTEVNTLLLVGSDEVPPEQAPGAAGGSSAAKETGTGKRCSLLFRSRAPQGRALAFPCDARGNVTLAGFCERTRADYLHARAGVGREFEAPVIQRD